MTNPPHTDPSLKDLIEQARSSEIRLHLRPIGLPGEPFRAAKGSDGQSSRG